MAAGSRTLQVVWRRTTCKVGRCQCLRPATPSLDTALPTTNPSPHPIPSAAARLHIFISKEPGDRYVPLHRCALWLGQHHGQDAPPCSACTNTKTMNVGAPQRHASRTLNAAEKSCSRLAVISILPCSPICAVPGLAGNPADPQYFTLRPQSDPAIFKLSAKAASDAGCIAQCNDAFCSGSYAAKGSSVATEGCAASDGSQGNQWSLSEVTGKPAFWPLLAVCIKCCGRMCWLRGQGMLLCAAARPAGTMCNCKACWP